jgi:NAD(P)-dependent dehydrogenase (short-subunit alcohol dehydrogenase family)
MPTLFITGAGGGLGREFVRQYSGAGWNVIAPTRADMDVTDEKSIAAFVSRLGDTGIDVLINNAGMRNPGPEASRLGAFTRDGWLPTLSTNVIGPALVTQALLPCLRRGPQKKIVILSSRLGSFAQGGGGNSGGVGSSYYAYRVSKSAVNQLGRCLAIDLGPEGFTCVLLDPGWVRTPMGGAQAALDPHDSVARMIAQIEALGHSDNGRFVSLNGETVGW